DLSAGLASTRTAGAWLTCAGRRASSSRWPSGSISTPVFARVAESGAAGYHRHRVRTAHLGGGDGVARGRACSLSPEGGDTCRLTLRRLRHGDRRGVDLMPRFDNPRPFGARAIAFVFQGGGSLTAAQVCIFWPLTEAGRAPDLVVGFSAGALNAVAFASDPSPDGLDHLEAVSVSLRRRRVAPFSPRALLAALAGRGDAFVSDTALQVLLEWAALART